MKIYFAGSIRGGREDAILYQQIINHLKKYGQVLTEHIGDTNLASEHELTDRYIHDRDMEWLLTADILVAEVTVASMGVGYEIGRAVENGIKVICLYRPDSGRRLSAMVAGSPLVTVHTYSTREEAEQLIDQFLKEEN